MSEGRALWSGPEGATIMALPKRFSDLRLLGTMTPVFPLPFASAFTPTLPGRSRLFSLLLRHGRLPHGCSLATCCCICRCCCCLGRSSGNESR